MILPEVVIMFVPQPLVVLLNEDIKLTGIGVVIVKCCSTMAMNKPGVQSALVVETTTTLLDPEIINYLMTMQQTRSTVGGGALAAKIFTTRTTIAFPVMLGDAVA